MKLRFLWVAGTAVLRSVADVKVPVFWVDFEFFVTVKVFEFIDLDLRPDDLVRVGCGIP